MIGRQAELASSARQSASPPRNVQIKLAMILLRPRNSRPIRPFSLIMNSQATNDAGEQQDTAKTVAPGLWPALKGAASDWSAHKSAKAGAAIAYYSIFSIGPLIVAAISLAALFFGREGV